MNTVLAEEENEYAEQPQYETEYAATAEPEAENEYEDEVFIPLILPIVEAELVGTLLWVTARSDESEIESVMVNGYQFHGREIEPESTIVIDITRFLEGNRFITVRAVDTRGVWSEPYEIDVLDVVQPPTLNVELVRDMLWITATSEYHEVEAVYVNGRRFNKRTDNALIIDVENFVSEERQITVYAVDMAGNVSNEITITIPRRQVFVPDEEDCFYCEDEETKCEYHGEEEYEVPEFSFNFPGDGWIVDAIEGGANPYLEFFTFTTIHGNQFYLIIDRARPGNNVYFLNHVHERDLFDLAFQQELSLHRPSSSTVHVPPPVEQIVEEEAPAQQPIPAPPPHGVETPWGAYAFIGVGAIIMFAVVYYLKIVKPKKDREEDDDYDEDEDNGEYSEGEIVYDTSDSGSEAVEVIVDLEEDEEEN